MDALNKYKSDLELLKTKKAQVQVKIEQAQKDAVALKQQLKDLGYENLQAAKDDYIRRMGDVEEKDKRVVDLLHQIENVEALIPTKEEILASMRENLKKSVEIVSEPELSQPAEFPEVASDAEEIKEKQDDFVAEVEADVDDDMFAGLGDLDL